ncbi:hypothetical protein H9P43_000714 [Blastocladiella emersonii ATCC 22665]|nr:hypothetical protein H9P43_000714 [Blastocladiella emersonii ATCC 22665]
MQPPMYTESVSPTRVDLHFDPAAVALTPLERVIMSSNGSLQRVLSAFYNAPIDVKLVKNVAVPQAPSPTPDAPVSAGTDEAAAQASRWQVDREIHLLCQGEVLCVAKSSLVITSPDYYDLLITRGVGLGQFFRHVGVLPAFELLEVRKPEAPADMFRLYTLSCPGVVCTIGETFPHWIADMDQPTRLQAAADAAAEAKASNGRASH